MMFSMVATPRLTPDPTLLLVRFACEWIQRGIADFDAARTLPDGTPSPVITLRTRQEGPLDIGFLTIENVPPGGPDPRGPDPERAFRLNRGAHTLEVRAHGEAPWRELVALATYPRNSAV